MKRKWLLHLAFWLTYLLFEAYVEFAWLGPSFRDISLARKWWFVLETELMFMPIKVGLVYFLFSLYFPNNEKPLAWPRVVAGTLLAFTLAVVGRRLVLVYVNIPIMGTLIPLDEPQNIFEVPLLNSSFIELLFISGVAMSIKAFRQRVRWKEREKNLVREKLESELKFLKAQINPHFLFNTLNNIYALARKQSDKTPEAVLKLSKLMRFMLYEARRETILVQEELRMIEDYIELERFRYNGRLNIQFHHQLDNPRQEIAPLLLIHFVENAFKHGASESRFEARIRIEVELKDGVLSATIENTKEETPTVEDREKIGLENIRRQLELLYPNHTLQVENRSAEFSVRLTIPLI
jgi:two-component sensor histidine kinase